MAAGLFGTSHVRTKQRCKYVTLVDIQDVLCKTESYSLLFRVTDVQSTMGLLRRRETVL